MQNEKTPNLEGLSEVEKQLIATYRRGLALEQQQAQCGDILPDFAPVPEANPQTRHDADFCNAAEVLAFAVITRLLANLVIQRSALFEFEMGGIVTDVAEAIADTAKRIGIGDLTK